MTKSEILDIINALQDSAKEAYGSGPGHAWASGYLGAVLAELLYNHVHATHKEFVLQDMVRYTERNQGITTTINKERINVT